MFENITIIHLIGGSAGSALIVTVLLISLGVWYWLPNKLRALKAKLSARDEQLTARDEVIEARDEQIKAKDADLEARSQQIVAREDQLRAKEEQLKLAKHQLASVTDQITPVIQEHQQATRKLLEEDLAGHENLYDVVKERLVDFADFIDNLTSTRDAVLPQVDGLDEKEVIFLKHIEELTVEKESLDEQLDKFRTVLDELREERVYGSITADTIANAHGTTSKTLHMVGTLANMEAVAKRITSHMPAAVKEAVNESAVVITLSPPGMGGLLGGAAGAVPGLLGAGAGDVGRTLANLESSSLNRLLHRVEHSVGGGLLPDPQADVYQDILIRGDEGDDKEPTLEIHVEDHGDEEEAEIAQSA